jgi:hypothetical protein
MDAKNADLKLTQALRPPLLRRLKRSNKGKYDYSLVRYMGTKTKVNIICPKHGVFPQRPTTHLEGKGCKQCHKDSLWNTDKFIEAAKKLHKGKYDYSLVVYTNWKAQVSIICPIHGVYPQKACDHLIGKGCSRCINKVSKSETEWLDSLSANIQRQVSIRVISENRPIRVDGFDPKTNTVYEFYGDYWHGNPKVYEPNFINPQVHKTMGELYAKTKKREKAIKKAGYKLITMWGKDWKELKKSNKKLTRKKSPH